MRRRFASLAGRGHHLLLGGIVSVALSTGTAVLSSWPKWQSVADDAGLIRLSFTHSGGRICRDRTPEELAALPPNMRSAQVCERRRAPVRVEMDIDGEPVVATELPPSGLAGSGPSRAYKRLVLPAGSYEIVLRMRDDPLRAEFTHEHSRQVTLEPGQNLAIDFRSATGEFVFH
jgi:hypothetical protein